MIVYDLRCANGHQFEGWFDDRDGYEAEKNSGRLQCPICENPKIEIIPSGGHFSKKTPNEKLPGNPKSNLLAFEIFLQENFENVGTRFPEEALKMHFGDIDPRNIRGSLTSEEEKELEEVGVDFLNLALPKFNS